MHVMGSLILQLVFKFPSVCVFSCMWIALICIFAVLSFHSMFDSFALKCLVRSLEVSTYTGFLFFNSIVWNVNCWASCAEIYIECHYQQWDCCVCNSFHCFQLNEKSSSKLYSPISFVYIGLLGSIWWFSLDPFISSCTYKFIFVHTYLLFPCLEFSL